MVTGHLLFMIEKTVIEFDAVDICVWIKYQTDFNVKKLESILPKYDVSNGNLSVEFTFTKSDETPTKK
jgi:hypothetical protein